MGNLDDWVVVGDGCGNSAEWEPTPTSTWSVWTIGQAEMQLPPLHDVVSQGVF